MALFSLGREPEGVGGEPAEAQRPSALISPAMPAASAASCISTRTATPRATRAKTAWPACLVEAADAPTNGQTYSATTTTAADGSYQFSGLSANTYRVTQTDPAGYVSTTAGSLDVVVGSSPVSGVDFGDAIPLTVTGAVFDDLDANGVQKPAEPGIPDRLVDVVDDLNGNGQADAGEPVLGSQGTDAQGHYAIPGHQAGPAGGACVPDPAAPAILSSGPSA